MVGASAQSSPWQPHRAEIRENRQPEEYLGSQLRVNVNTFYSLIINQRFFSLTGDLFRANNSMPVIRIVFMCFGGMGVREGGGGSGGRVFSRVYSRFWRVLEARCRWHFVRGLC
jgi:hypothetical protein